MDTPNLTEPEKNWHKSGCIVVSILQYKKNEQPLIGSSTIYVA